MDDDEHFTEDDEEGGYVALAPRPYHWTLVPLRVVEFIHNILLATAATFNAVASDIARADAYREIRRDFAATVGEAIESIPTTKE